MTRQRRPDLGRDRAEVLSDDHRPRSASFGEHDGVELARGRSDVRPGARRGSRRDPEEPMKTEHVVDPNDAGDRELVAQRLSKGPVALRPGPLGNPGGELPVLATRHPGVRGRTDVDAACVEEGIALAVEPSGVGAERKVKSESDPSKAQPPGDLPQLFIDQPLGERMVALSASSTPLERRPESGVRS